MDVQNNIQNCHTESNCGNLPRMKIKMKDQNWLNFWYVILSFLNTKIIQYNKFHLDQLLLKICYRRYSKFVTAEHKWNDQNVSISIAIRVIKKMPSNDWLWMKFGHTKSDQWKEICCIHQCKGKTFAFFRRQFIDKNPCYGRVLCDMKKREFRRFDVQKGELYCIPCNMSRNFLTLFIELEWLKSLVLQFCLKLLYV